MDGSVLVSAARERERHSVIDQIPTSLIARHRRALTHLSKVGGRKEKKVKYLINKWIIPNKTIGGGKSWPTSTAW